MQTSSLKSVIGNGIFSAATTRALDPWKFFKAVNWISSVLIPKSMRCEAQIARIWLLRRRVSQSLPALPKPVSTGVENACKIDELKRFTTISENKWRFLYLPTL